jgi:hypothetical protein
VLADDGGARGASFIGFGEKAALKKTKAHEGEIVRGDVSAGGELCALDRIPWISLGVVNVVEIVSGHGKGADDGCVFNSCVSAKLADELLEEGLGNSVDGDGRRNCRRSSREPEHIKVCCKVTCDTYRCQHRYGRTYVGHDAAIPKFHAYVSGSPRLVEPIPLKLTVMPVVPKYDHQRSPAKVTARDVSV